MKNVRDYERDMLIYYARKVDKRTYADIGKEFGIGPERVRQVYRRTDWKINRENSDAWRKRKARGIIDSPKDSED